MKTQIRNIKSNPFRIGGFRKEALEMLEDSMTTKKIGHFGSFPVRKTKNGKFELACRHHTLEALKRKHGSNFEVTVTVHDYDDEQMFLVLYRENLTQRGTDRQEYFNAVSETVKWVQKHYKVKNVESHHVSAFLNHGDPHKSAHGRIASSKNVARFFHINKNLHRDLLQDAIGGYVVKKNDNEIYLDTFEALSMLRNRSEQLKVAAAVRGDAYLGGRNEQTKSINSYKTLPAKYQAQILKGTLTLSDAPLITKINGMAKEAKDRSSASISSNKKFGKMKVKAEDFLLVGLIEKLNKSLKAKPIYRRAKAHELQVMLQALSKTVTDNLKSFKSKAKIVQMPVSPKKRGKRSVGN